MFPESWLLIFINLGLPLINIYKKKPFVKTNFRNFPQFYELFEKYSRTKICGFLSMWVDWRSAWISCVLLDTCMWMMRSFSSDATLQCVNFCERSCYAQPNFIFHASENQLSILLLVCRCRPNLVDFDSLDPSNAHENLSNAFNLAEQEVGVLRLLDAEGKKQKSTKSSWLVSLWQAHCSFSPCLG